MEEPNYFTFDMNDRRIIEAIAKKIERFAGSGEGSQYQRDQARLAAAYMNRFLDSLEGETDEG